jgi:hypothetical protein
MENHKHEVSIHIDQKPYESQNPTCRVFKKGVDLIDLEN